QPNLALIETRFGLSVLGIFDETFKSNCGTNKRSKVKSETTLPKIASHPLQMIPPASQITSVRLAKIARQLFKFVGKSLFFLQCCITFLPLSFTLIRILLPLTLVVIRMFTEHQSIAHLQASLDATYQRFLGWLYRDRKSTRLNSSHVS